MIRLLNHCFAALGVISFVLPQTCCGFVPGHPSPVRTDPLRVSNWNILNWQPFGDNNPQLFDMSGKKLDVARSLKQLLSFGSSSQNVPFGTDYEKERKAQLRAQYTEAVQKANLVDFGDDYKEKLKQQYVMAVVASHQQENDLFPAPLPPPTPMSEYEIQRAQFEKAQLMAAKSKAVAANAPPVNPVAPSKRVWNFNRGASPYGLDTNAEIWNGRIAMVRLFVLSPKPQERIFAST